MKKILLFCLFIFSPATFADNEEALEQLQEYLDFAEYASGTISIDQLAQIADDQQITFIDARNAKQYEDGHIPGAINIEWREVIARKDEIPKDRPVIMYCETGLLSSKAQLMLTLDGYNNIKVLWGGYLVWITRQSFEDAMKVRNRPLQ